MKTIFVCISILSICQSLIAQRKASSNSQKEAVLVIGSDINSIKAEAQMEKIELFLDSMNYKVHTFYDPYNSWDEIKKASANSSIFIYRGHGTHLGIGGGFGGIVIEEFISGQKISEELKFKNDPLVIFISVCGGAGSSAGDETDIGVPEAQKRVLGSALPFLLAGAKGYYADNYETGALRCLQLMSENKTLEETYKINASRWTKIEKIESVNDNRVNPIYQIGISSLPGGRKATIISTKNGVSTRKEIISPKDYPIAFIGDPNFRLFQANYLSKNK